MTSDNILFELDNVHFTYSHHGQASTDGHAVAGISLHIGEGEYVAVAGSNGSGKSTFAKLLVGLIRPTSGSVRLLGQPLDAIQDSGQLARYVGIVMQNPDLQSAASIVEEDVAFVLENLQIPYKEMHERVEQALRTVDMWSYRDREVHHLSGGQRQRTAIAGVLAASPKCIVFDEATSMLDAIGRREVREEMKRLADAGHTVIAITHHVDEMMDADRLLVFDRGLCMFDGTPKNAFTSEGVQSLLPDAPASTMAAQVLGAYHSTASTNLTAGQAAYIIREIHSQSPGDVRKCDDGFDTPCDRGENAHVGDDLTSGERASRPLVIDIHGLSHIYGRGTPRQTVALHDVSLQVSEGEIVAVMGATGSGKSTLGLYLNGLYRAGRGVVTVFGMDASDRRHAMTLRRRVGMLFQKSEDQIFETLIGDEIAYGPFRFGATVDEARAAVQSAMEEVGLDFTWRDRPTRWLSGGQRRRVAMASVLAQQPDLLVLDEPTLGLDPNGRKALLDDLLRLRRDRGLTILFVTHHVEEVAAVADRVVVLDSGRCVMDTTPDAWFSDVVHVHKAGFELPSTPQYVLELCDALGISRPQPIPVTSPAFRTWLEDELLLRNRPSGLGGHGHGEL